MLIGGLQKTTLLDYPGKLACTVFTVGCNFRCPFCHNRSLIDYQVFLKEKGQLISETEWWKFAETKKKVLDGVCITGGEPTLQPDLEEFCGRVKKMGLLVKVDTNGSHPEVVAGLIKGKLVDYWAMDVKTNWDGYGVVGAHGNAPIPNIKESMKMIINSGVEYEFRTTLVPGIHSQEVIKKMEKEIAAFVPTDRDSGEPKWYWQNFWGRNCWDRKMDKMEGFKLSEIKKWQKSINLPVGLKGW